MNQIKKVCFISKDANWQIYRLDIFKKLSITYNINIDILTIKISNNHINDTAKVRYIEFRNIFKNNRKISFFPGAIYYLFKNRPDVVLALNNISQLTEYCALCACKMLKIKFVWWTHAYDHDPLSYNPIFRKIREQYFLFFLNKSDNIITFSHAGKKYLVSKNISSTKIFNAPNTLDTDRLLNEYNRLSKRNNENLLKKKHGFNIEDKIILFSGRMLFNKKIDNLINAIKLVIKSHPHIKLLLIGDGNALSYYKSLVNKEIDKNIIFKGALYEENILSEFFYISSIFCIPAYAGLAIVHAFCFGLPILIENSINHGPEFNYIENGYNSVVVEENNIEMMANELIKLLDDDSYRRKLSNNAISTINEEANIDKMIFNIYKGLIK